MVLFASGQAKAILVAGKPLREHVVQHGQFVMNSKEKILQDIKDFNEGSLADAG